MNCITGPQMMFHRAEVYICARGFECLCCIEAFAVTVCLGHIQICSLASLISNKMAELTFSYTVQLTGCTNRQWLQT